jgi:hypothetical protein
VKILPVTLFRKLVPAFRHPPLTIKDVPKAACDPENCSENECTLKKFDLWERRKAGTNLLCGF